MKIQFVCVALATMLAHAASAQATSQPAASIAPVGTWRGTSRCLVRPSACNDESVVYRITQLEAADSVAIDARRIAGGKEVEMGVLGCRYVATRGEIICAIPQGVWDFNVRAHSLTGELRLRDNTRYREVRAKRAS